MEKIKFANSLSIGIEIGGTKTQVGIGTPENGLLPDAIAQKVYGAISSPSSMNY
jgi:hypothetical protein